MAPNRRLKQARELRGWSQAKVAEEIETDATTVSRWERGLFSPTPYFRERLCRLFGQNAEELGLLEIVDQLQNHERSNSVLHHPISLQAWPKETTERGNIGALMAPSWSKRTDTFSYIQHSDLHDHQAHMLWNDAYVRALRGQYAEAQQLGEASLSAFEDVGHFNAIAVREWLDQREVASPSANMLSMTQPILPERRKQTRRRFTRGKNAGIVLTLLIVVVLISAGFAVEQWGSIALASPPVGHILPIATYTQSPAKLASNPLPAQAHSSISTPALAPLPTATLTPSPIASSVSSSTLRSNPSLGFVAQIIPSKLNSGNCPQETLGYRCTLQIWLSTMATVKENIVWSASSANLPAQFNPARGINISGETVQVIAYIHCLAGQTGRLVFVFTVASTVYTVYANWGG